MKKPNHERVREALHYSDGRLFWKIDRPGTAKIGARAGRLHPTGYRHTMLDGFRAPEHWFVWFMHTGQWPDEEIDHINRIRDDNRIENLRAVSRSENMRNKSVYKNCPSGVPGVRPHGKSWEVYVGNTRIGRYEHFRHAVLARKFHECVSDFRSAI